MIGSNVEVQYDKKTKVLEEEGGIDLLKDKDNKKEDNDLLGDIMTGNTQSDTN